MQNQTFIDLLGIFLLLATLLWQHRNQMVNNETMNLVESKMVNCVIYTNSTSSKQFFLPRKT